MATGRMRHQQAAPFGIQRGICKSAFRKYILCMFWSTMTLTTIGERPAPVTDVEYIFTGITFLVGVFVFAAVVGNVGDVISNLNAARRDFQARMDQIKFYMNHRNVPEHLQTRIKRWAEYTWDRTKAIDEPSALQFLPNKLRTEMAIHVHLDVLKKVSMFGECEEGLLRELVLKLRPQIFSPGDYICRIGEIGREMYIINHGKVEILLPDLDTGASVQVVVMQAGNFFGEISLLKLGAGQNKRTADVRSIGFSELLCLSRRDLIVALAEYPEAKKILEEYARQRFNNTRRLTPPEPEDSRHVSPRVSYVSTHRKRTARQIFTQVMRQEGFSKLLPNVARSKWSLQIRELTPTQERGIRRGKLLLAPTQERGIRRGKLWLAPTQERGIRRGKLLLAPIQERGIRRGKLLLAPTQERGIRRGKLLLAPTQERGIRRGKLLLAPTQERGIRRGKLLLAPTQERGIRRGKLLLAPTQERGIRRGKLLLAPTQERGIRRGKLLLAPTQEREMQVRNAAADGLPKDTSDLGSQRVIAGGFCYSTSVLGKPAENHHNDMGDSLNYCYSLSSNSPWTTEKNNTSSPELSRCSSFQNKIVDRCGFQNEIVVSSSFKSEITEKRSLTNYIPGNCGFKNQTSGSYTCNTDITGSCTCNTDITGSCTCNTDITDSCTCNTDITDSRSVKTDIPGDRGLENEVTDSYNCKIEIQVNSSLTDITLSGSVALIQQETDVLDKVRLVTRKLTSAPSPASPYFLTTDRGHMGHRETRTPGDPISDMAHTYVQHSDSVYRRRFTDPHSLSAISSSVSMKMFSDLEHTPVSPYKTRRFATRARHPDKKVASVYRPRHSRTTVCSLARTKCKALKSPSSTQCTVQTGVCSMGCSTSKDSSSRVIAGKGSVCCLEENRSSTLPWRQKIQ